NEGIIGEGMNLSLEHTQDMRQSTVLFHLTQRLLNTRFRDANGEPKLHLFGQLKRIARDWLEDHLVCKGKTYPAQLLYLELADMACERINAGIVAAHMGTNPITAVLDPYNPNGSTRHVRFQTSTMDRWETDPRGCHINYVVLDSGWEGELCRAVESHPRVRAYVKNHNLGLEVPYRMAGTARRYRPDFIVLVDDGRGEDDLLRLVVEIKGRRGEDAKAKAEAMRTHWIPAVNHLGSYGRWAVAEFTDEYAIEDDFAKVVHAQVQKLIAGLESGSRLVPVGAAEEAPDA
ncbi:MAG: restriction endonuclease, partial [Gemmatimonadales bacterium]